MNKLIILGFALIVGIGIIIFSAIFGIDDSLNANDYQKKKTECNDNQDWIYVDIFGNFCCTSEKYVILPEDGEICPTKMEFIYTRF